MSVGQKTQRAAVAPRPRRMCSKEAALRASATTRYPSWAKVSTKRAPMPSPTPATTATFSFAMFVPPSSAVLGYQDQPVGMRSRKNFSSSYRLLFEQAFYIPLVMLQVLLHHSLV